MNTHDLLALPFDQYQRYQVVAQIAEQVRAAWGCSTLRILDVGGFCRTRQGHSMLPLAQFLPNDQIVAVDLVAEPLCNYILADGRALPFGTRSFDLVVSCDTLEHVPQTARLAFVDELLRVAAHLLILTAPFESEATCLAERLLSEYMSTHGVYHAQLQEHIDLGLPSADLLRDHLTERKLATVDLADGYLHHWLAMMLIKHTPGYPLSFHLDLDRYYNLHFSPGDRREPAYRRVFVVALPGNEALLTTIASSLDPADTPAGSPDLIPELLRFLSHYEAERVHSRLVAVEAENARLHQIVAGYERGHFIRLMRWVHHQRARLKKKGIP